MSGPLPTVTCDQCRVRKVRCSPGARRVDRDSDSASTSPSDETSKQSHEPCKNCVRRREVCTYEYMPKKPGRPRAPRTRRSNGTPSPKDSESSADEVVSMVDTSPPELPPASPSLLGPSLGSIFGSARQTLQSIEFDYTLPRTREGSPVPLFSPPSNPPLLETAPLGLLDVHAPTLPTFDFAIQQPERTARAVYSPSTTLTDLISASETAGTAGNNVASGVQAMDVSRIENFATWEDIGFFLSLHMKHQHMLVPLVHRPSFAQDVLHRRDENDEAFRGLLLSMVAYTICQCPINWLVGRMDKPRLEALLERCQRGSRVIQIRHQTRPSLVIAASTILDWITSQSASPAEVPANLMSDVRRLVYTLGLNREIPKEGLSPLEIQLCRRLFWEAYAIDKTNALNGHPVNLHDMDGCPPLPLDVDDEFMTADSENPKQPPGKLSYMTGFSYISKLFKVLSGCVVRHRTLSTDPSCSPSGPALIKWVANSLEDVQSLLAQMPKDLHPESITHGMTHTLFGTQAANLYVTALCIELALIDLGAKVEGESENGAQESSRAELAQRAFRQLEHMPLECLASNGESMRGKVLRVVLALLGGGQDTVSEGLWDWWNMYSRVQFIQLLPELRA